MVAQPPGAGLPSLPEEVGVRGTAGTLWVAGLLALLGGAGAARAAGFDSPHGYRIELPEGWDAVDAETLEKLGGAVAKSGMKAEGAWRDSGEAFTFVCWWPGDRISHQAAEMIDQATDRSGFPARFERLMEGSFPLKHIEVRRSDPRRRVMTLSGVMTQQGQTLHGYIVLQACRGGVVLVYLFAQEADESLYTATFDGLARSLEVVPGHEYQPRPRLALIGAGLGVALVGGVVLLSRRRQR